MVTTVTLNPCMDLTIKMRDVTLGQLNLAESTRTDVAGKGVNVSIVLRELGVETAATGLSFTGNGKKLADYLALRGICGDFVMAEGDIRTNIKLIDTAKNEMTELNSRGDIVDAAIIAALPCEIAKRLQQSDLVVFSGRIPNGAPETIIADCMREMRDTKSSAKIIVDAEKAPLLHAVAEKPYLIKPNLYELGHSFGCSVDTMEDILTACRKVIGLGVAVVCVSMGEKGAVIADGETAYFAPALDVVPLGFQGAGDSMVAGMCAAIQNGLPLPELLRYGTAAATGSIIREGTLLCERAEFERFLPMVKVEKLEY